MYRQKIKYVRDHSINRKKYVSLFGLLHTKFLHHFFRYELKFEPLTCQHFEHKIDCYKCYIQPDDF
jgi:hypothetical protein